MQLFVILLCIALSYAGCPQLNPFKDSEMHPQSDPDCADGRPGWSKPNCLCEYLVKDKDGKGCASRYYIQCYKAGTLAKPKVSGSDCPPADLKKQAQPGCEIRQQKNSDTGCTETIEECASDASGGSSGYGQIVDEKPAPILRKVDKPPMVASFAAKPPPQQCVENEEFRACQSSSCVATCKNPEPGPACSRDCRRGCYCKTPLVRNEDTGECVAVSDCPRNEECGPDEEFSECHSSSCIPNCKNPVPGPICTLDCRRGCLCKKPLVRNEETGECVAVSECPRTEECGPDEEFSECHSFSCIPTCKNPVPGPICTADCRQGCLCVNPLVRNTATGACVSVDECPKDEPSRVVELVQFSGTTSVSCGDKKQEALNNGPMIGMFVPNCKDDGTWSPLQCHGSTGHCWCVDSDGTEMEGTKAGPGEPTPSCDEAPEKPPAPLLLASRQAGPDVAPSPPKQSGYR